MDFHVQSRDTVFGVIEAMDNRGCPALELSVRSAAPNDRDSTYMQKFLFRATPGSRAVVSVRVVVNRLTTVTALSRITVEDISTAK